MILLNWPLEVLIELSRRVEMNVICHFGVVHLARTPRIMHRDCTESSLSNENKLFA